MPPRSLRRRSDSFATGLCIWRANLGKGRTLDIVRVLPKNTGRVRSLRLSSPGFKKSLQMICHFSCPRNTMPEVCSRHRKKFSYEKLQRAFEQEMARVKDVARAMAAEAKEAPLRPPRSLARAVRKAARRRPLAAPKADVTWRHVELDARCPFWAMREIFLPSIHGSIVHAPFSAEIRPVCDEQSESLLCPESDASASGKRRFAT